MRLFHALTVFCAIPMVVGGAESNPSGVSEIQQKLGSEFAKRFQAAEKQGTHAIVGADGWLFLPGELRFLSVGKFWGEDAPKVSRAQKPEQADPLPAILNFRDQLKQRGIELLLVPVPPKAAIYPEEILPDFNAGRDDAASYLHRFYDELRGHGVEVLDLSGSFIEKREGEHGAVFCKTDTHWSGAGCVLAAQAIAEKVRNRLGLPVGRDKYSIEWKQIEINGDLAKLLSSKSQKPAAEKIQVRTVTDKATGKHVQSDPNSPLLLLGDSHTLVYHEFHAEAAGLADQIAEILGFAPDWLGTRGSGATTVRLGLYRRSHRDTSYLSKKKMIIWCFAAREFTEADAWAQLPVSP
jgi:hypothetical protein